MKNRWGLCVIKGFFIEKVGWKVKSLLWKQKNKRSKNWPLGIIRWDLAEWLSRCGVGTLAVAAINDHHSPLSSPPCIDNHSITFNRTRGERRGLTELQWMLNWSKLNISSINSQEEVNGAFFTEYQDISHSLLLNWESDLWFWDISVQFLHQIEVKRCLS